MSTLSQVPRSAGVGVAMLAVSLVVHLGALAWQEAPAPIAIAGGTGAELAMEGTAFVDLVAGVTAPVAQPDTITPVQTPVTPSVTSPVSATPVAPSDTVQATKAVTATVPVPETATAVPEDNSTTPPVSARPTARPPEVAARAEAAQPAPAPAPQGNAQASARAGAVGGQTAGQAASSGAANQQAASDAAVSSYPGLVQQRIASQRQPRIRATGIARVSFTIAESGSLAAVSLAASSGDARFDQAAVAMISGAAPFPAPPPGAQRSFTIPIRAR
ncbi:outer membrane transport energization protein TonB [Yoonia maricola]|uniref:Outer membrane transport energization protein TonB n=1 Tax=Yoonia maricola TaxID=420999 RepID=A0A2M8W029_9RHOB|nr:energy transducer TonB [Yoonia maricola]PJI84283.1 outer membrane transport energization protein TonB [Yoonia maricola]